MAFDFKKEYKEFYLPKSTPQIVTVPKANYIAVRGQGDPNEENGAYKTAVGTLYAVAYTIKMSKLSDQRIQGYFDFVVPPLEGFWWQDDVAGVDYSHKSAFHWISVIRLPDFVTRSDFVWAVETASKKKELDCSAAEFLTVEEGLCVQILHLGPFDAEPESVAKMDAYLAENGYENDFSATRLHHEVYLSDARKVAPEKWKTVIRHPIKKKENGNPKKDKALVVIDIQNDITKNYKEIIDNVNAAIDWAFQQNMPVVYLKHNNLSAGTRTFKPGTQGAELVPEMKIVSDHIFIKTKGNALTSEKFSAFIKANDIEEFFIVGADALACVKATCYNMAKNGYVVHVLSDCITSYDKRKIADMLEYYASKGCKVETLREVM